MKQGSLKYKNEFENRSHEKSIKIGQKSAAGQKSVFRFFQTDFLSSSIFVKLIQIDQNLIEIWKNWDH